MQSRLISVCLLSFWAGLSHAGHGLTDRTPSLAHQEWMARHSNPRPTGLGLRDPKAYAALMDTASDPRFLASAMLAGTNPQTYMAYLRGLRDPEALREGLKLMTPQVALDRAYSATDPEFQNALLSRASEPGMARHWMDAMRDPAYFQSAVGVVNARSQWLKLDADGHTQPAVDWLDPKTYSGWIRLSLSPAANATLSMKAPTKPRAPLFVTPPQRY